MLLGQYEVATYLRINKCICIKENSFRFIFYTITCYAADIFLIPIKITLKALVDLCQSKKHLQMSILKYI